GAGGVLEVPSRGRAERRGGLLRPSHARGRSLGIRVRLIGAGDLRGLGHSVTSDEQERGERDHQQDEAVSQPIRDPARVEDAREDAIAKAVDRYRDEERDPNARYDVRQVLGKWTLNDATRRGQGAARLEHL